MPLSLAELLNSPRASASRLATALWNSLSLAEREAGMRLTPEDGAELDRRWVDYVQRPESAIHWGGSPSEAGCSRGHDDLRPEYDGHGDLHAENEC
jgi:hypothetical protein